jgi:hypothetical protein
MSSVIINLSFSQSREGAKKTQRNQFFVFFARPLRLRAFA